MTRRRVCPSRGRPVARVSRSRRSDITLYRSPHGTHPEDALEYRQLGRSGFKVPALSLGTGTFGGGTEFFKSWGDTDAQGAARLIDVCLDAGLTLQVARLDAASAVTLPYPYWHQRGFAERNPPPAG